MTGQIQHSEDDALAGLLRRRRPVVWLVLAVLYVVLAASCAVMHQPLPATGWGAVAVCWGTTWWNSPQPALRRLTTDGLVVRQRSRTRTIPRVDVLDVQPKHGGPYGVELTLRNADPLLLRGTAPRFSVAQQQAEALRRWVGPAAADAPGAREG